jgi:periplasmic protein TonB
MLRFVVNEDGSISNITTIQSDKQRFNQAAINVVKSMPRWSPGIQGGQKVRVYFELPFSFN